MLGLLRCQRGALRRKWMGMPLLRMFRACKFPILFSGRVCRGAANVSTSLFRSAP